MTVAVELAARALFQRDVEEAYQNDSMVPLLPAPRH
jgi:hypothetical protein